MADTELYQCCLELSKIIKTPILSFVLPAESILPQHLIEISKLLCEKRCEHLSIILHSSGGDIHCAYQIVDYLRTHCDYMTTIIPIYAKSAATLFILGSNGLIMGELAELGPLDTQISETREGSRRYSSALNPFKTLEELKRFALETFDIMVKFILRRADFSIKEAVKLGIDFVSQISTPLFSQLNVEKMGEYSRALEVGREYGDRLLRRFTKYKDDEGRDRILRKLIYGYPSHSYIIDYKEIEEIGFDVEVATKDTKKILKKIMEYVIKSTTTEIFLIEYEEKEASSKKMEGDNNGDRKNL